MARGDVKGGGRGIGKLREREAQKQENAAEEQADIASNVEVGDFLSELNTALTYKAQYNLREGDFLEDPERAYTDGYAFGQEIRTAIQGKLQISLCLDVSTSMWMNDLMRYAGPTFHKMDQIIRKAAAEAPEGALLYDTFIFHGVAKRLPEAFIQRYHGGKQTFHRGVLKGQAGISWPAFPREEDVQEAMRLGQIPEGDTRVFRAGYPMSGPETKIAPLFKLLSEWETKFGDPSAKRLDIILTDGVLEDRPDVNEASRIQEARNGDLSTICLNFLKPQEWAGYALPDRVVQYAVNAENLATRLRDIITETISAM